MGMGMMIAAGAMGGLGSSMVNEADVMQKAEVRKQEQADRMALESWRMATAEQYQIKADQRAWDNEVARAPVKRDMKVADATADAAGKLKFETDNLGTITGNTQAMSDAKESTSKKALDAAHADALTSTAEYNRGARADAAGAKKLEIQDPVLRSQISHVETEIKELSKIVSESKVKDGGWAVTKDPATGKEVVGTPSQRAQEAQLGALILKRTNLYQQASGGAPVGGRTDRFGVRSKIGGAQSDPSMPTPQAVTPGYFTGNPDDAAMAIEQIKNPQERANAMASLQLQMRKSGGALPAAGTVSPPNAPRAQTGMPPMVGPGASLPAAAAPAKDESLAGFQPDAIMDAKAQAEDAEMGAGKRMKYSPEVGDYVKKVRRLRDMAAAQERSQAGVREASRTRANLGL